MARLPEVINFGEKFDMPVLTIENLVAYRLNQQEQVA